MQFSRVIIPGADEARSWRKTGRPLAVRDQQFSGEIVFSRRLPQAACFCFERSTTAELAVSSSPLL